MRRVAYTNVTRSSQNMTWHTDRIPGLYPDPLPPFGALELTADTTQCLWLTAAVRADAPAGTHAGKVRLLGPGGAELAQVPVSLRVWPYAISNVSLVTDSALCGYESYRWGEQADQWPDFTREQVTASYMDQMMSHRVNWITFGQVFPQINATLSPDLSSVTLDTAGFDRMARALLARGLRQMSFPKVSSDLDLAVSGGAKDGREFRGIQEEWSHSVMPNATWKIDGLQLSVFDRDKTTWRPANPVLNETFVRVYKLVYGAVLKHVVSQGLIDVAHTISVVDEPMLRDDFTTTALILLIKFVKALHPAIRIQQTTFPLGTRSCSQALPLVRGLANPASVAARGWARWNEPSCRLCSEAAQLFTDGQRRVLRELVADRIGAHAARRRFRGALQAGQLSRGAGEDGRVAAAARRSASSHLRQRDPGDRQARAAGPALPVAAVADESRHRRRARWPWPDRKFELVL